MRIAIFVMLVSAGVSPSVFAHGGGLDANGCHNDRKNGGYHCHRGASVPMAASHIERRGAVPSRTGGYRNCSEARAAGAAPVRRGTPGYGSHLDRDNDGIGCE